MTTPRHCPGFETFKNLEAFTCTCPQCGQEKEVFSDEFNKQHSCDKCRQPIDFKQCAWAAGTKPPS